MKYHSVCVFPGPLTAWESEDAGQVKGAADRQMLGSGTRERMRTVRRTAGWIPPAAYGGHQPRHLLYHSLSPRKRKAHRTCAAGRSRSFGGRGHRGRMASSRRPTVSSEQRVEAGAGPELREDNYLSQDPAGRPRMGKRRDTQTAAEDIRRHTALIGSSPALHLCRSRGLQMTD